MDTSGFSSDEEATIGGVVVGVVKSVLSEDVAKENGITKHVEEKTSKKFFGGNTRCDAIVVRKIISSYNFHFPVFLLPNKRMSTRNWKISY